MKKKDVLVVYNTAEELFDIASSRVKNGIVVTDVHIGKSSGYEGVNVKISLIIDKKQYTVSRIISLLQFNSAKFDFIEHVLEEMLKGVNSIQRGINNGKA